MGRTSRLHLPGAVFHLTSRLQGRQPLLDDSLKATVVDICLDSVSRDSCGGRVLAYAVMSNHLHLVLWQGGAPLGRIMQILLRRIALLVQRRHQCAGHVFERRYRDRACLDPGYVRNAIVYTHLNPVRQRNFDAVHDYAWTSHCEYMRGGIDSHPALAVKEGLALFASARSLGTAEQQQCYSRYLGWRSACDALLDRPDLQRPREPETLAGDVHAMSTFRLLDHQPAGAIQRRDLQAIAWEILCAVEPPIPLDYLRSGLRSPELVRVRRHIIEASLAAGYSVSKIAQYLRVTPSAVSHAVRRTPHGNT